MGTYRFKIEIECSADNEHEADLIRQHVIETLESTTDNEVHSILRAGPVQPAVPWAPSSPRLWPQRASTNGDGEDGARPEVPADE